MMNHIKAGIIADSLSPQGHRLTTFVLTFPRIILAELNTHRMFSRNSASSRAIPFSKMVEGVTNTPFIPLAWQNDHSGMQGTRYISDPDIIERKNKVWLNARDKAIISARELHDDVIAYSGPNTLSPIPDTNVTKQLCNRLLEPYMYHTCILTATEFENFFALRCPQYEIEHKGTHPKIEFLRSKKDVIKRFEDYGGGVGDKRLEDLTPLEWMSLNKGQGEIHIMALAEAMWDAYNENTPVQLKAGEWHIPFGDNIDYWKVNDIVTQHGQISYFAEPIEEMNRVKVKIATARCARVSYTVVGEEGKPDDYAKDITLHDRLVASGHMSPTEHCAQAMNEDQYLRNFKTEGYEEGYNAFVENGWSGNFRGFVQYRKTIQGENIV